MALLTVSCGRGDSRVYRELDEALRNRDSYEAYFRSRVDVLEGVLSDQQSSEQKYKIIKSIANEFKSNSFDSTIHYLGMNRRLAEVAASEEMRVETELMLAEEYAIAGYHVEASEILMKYSSSSVPSSQKQRYFHVVHVLAGEMLGYSKSEEVYKEKTAQRDAARDSLLALLPKDGFGWNFLMQEKAAGEADDSLRRHYALRMLGTTRENSHEYAVASYFYAMSFPDGDPLRTEWLVVSAIADMMSNTKDYESLNKISRDLFEAGEIHRAFRYTADYCMGDALYFNGKLRPWQISRFFPQLEKAYEREIQGKRRMMATMIIVALWLLVVLALLLVMNSRRQRALRESNRKLVALNSRIQEADKVKQEYIASFLSILSQNINETRQYKNHVLKYIRRGNEKYLVDEIEDLPPIDDDIQKFYKMFDRTFMNLYPDFIDQFNTLLADGEAIAPKEGDILTPELRVFALIKLGISDSSKIAALLHYSANTVYNYKARIKNKAGGDREKFEEEVKGL